jgi:hypothetical protein
MKLINISRMVHITNPLNFNIIYLRVISSLLGPSNQFSALYSNTRKRKEKHSANSSRTCKVEVWRLTTVPRGVMPDTEISNDNQGK